jgi:hypothetical protein
VVGAHGHNATSHVHDLITIVKMQGYDVPCRVVLDDSRNVGIGTNRMENCALSKEERIAESGYFSVPNSALREHDLRILFGSSHLLPIF